MFDEEKSIIDIFFDPDNHDPIFMADENGKEYRFDQVALIPLGESLYVILTPIDEIEGVASNEALVFYLDIEDEYNFDLKLERDEEISKEVFEKYYQLIDETDDEEH